MRDLSGAELLEVWERAESLPPVERAAGLLASVVDKPADELARLPLGQRDALLFAMRAALFGDQLTGCTPCPACGRTVEFTIACSVMGAAPASSEGGLRQLPDCADGRAWRLPDSTDLMAMAACPGADAAEQLLLERCCGSRADRDAFAAWVSMADPLAECLLDLTCPDCDAAWNSQLDILSFLYIEIRERAQRHLRQVGALARTYGWAERDILAMSAPRQAAYLRLAGHE